MDKARLDAIRARCEAATPGEWSVIPKGNALSVVAKSGAFTMNICHYSHKDGADAEFIAHARTDVPDMLAEIEHLRAKLQIAQDRSDANLAEADAWRRRAEAAEADMKRVAEESIRGDPSAICVICTNYEDADCGVEKQCEFEWRDPEEDKP